MAAAATADASWPHLPVGLEGRDELDFEDWMRKDMEYIDTWSLSLDWKILPLTIPRVLSGRGAN